MHSETRYRCKGVPSPRNVQEEAHRSQRWAGQTYPTIPSLPGQGRKRGRQGPPSPRGNKEDSPAWYAPSQSTKLQVRRWLRRGHVVAAVHQHHLQEQETWPCKATNLAKHTQSNNSLYRGFKQEVMQIRIFIVLKKT